MRGDRFKKIEAILLLRKKRRQKWEGSYYEFFKRAWRVLEPSRVLKDNWHLKYLCDDIQQEVERVARGEAKTKDLIVNICPRSLKSYIYSIMLCPYTWTRFPYLKFISSSHAKDLSMDHCVQGRRLIQSEWYQEEWGHVFQLTSDQNVKTNYVNDRTGSRYATSSKSGPLGKGADFVISDDQINPKQARSVAERRNSNDHYDKDLFSRLNDQTVGFRVIVQQRLHEEDTSGNALKNDPEGYRTICIPAELDENISPKELRAFYVDGLFFPDRFSRDFLARAKKASPKEYANQYLQRVTPEDGDIFKRKDFRFYQVLPQGLHLIQSWDLSVKDKEKNDWAVGQVWGRKGPNAYLVAQIRAKMGLKDSIKAILKMRMDYPEARSIYIEDKANGSNAMEILQSCVPGIIPVNPINSKVDRALAVTYLTEGGNVYVPDPTLQSWVYEFIDECVIFDNGSNDDQVDAMTQALMKLGFSDDTGVEALERFLTL